MADHDLNHNDSYTSGISPNRFFGCLLKAFGLLCIAALLMTLLLPEFRSAREPARRNSCVNNIKQIVLALHNYHDVYKVFPPAYTVDADGNPLHSWRTLILPFMEEYRLYKSIDLTKPWDDPVNAKAAGTVLSAYRCPSSDFEGNKTNYLALVTPNSCLRPGQSRNLSEITDGPSRTMIVTEVPLDQAVSWMSPHDADESMIMGIGENSKLAHPQLFIVGLADCAVRTLPADFPADKRRALITVDGGEPITDRDLE
jgi:hypothetical protein